MYNCSADEVRESVWVIVVERQYSTFAAILLQEQVNFQIDDADLGNKFSQTIPIWWGSSVYKFFDHATNGIIALVRKYVIQELMQGSKT